MESQKQISDEKLFNEIQTFVEWHPAKSHLYYFAHEHRMTLYHEKFADKDSPTAPNPPEKKDELCCHGCFNPIEHAMYGCTKTDTCRIFFHKACAELPRKINHPCHKSHPLTLVQDPSTNPPLVPDREDPSSNPPLVTATQDPRRNPPLVPAPQDPSRSPPLVHAPQDPRRNPPLVPAPQDPSRNPPLIPVPEISKRKCSGCNLPIFRAATYACNEESCKDAFLFHKSCLELPRTIAHSKHPSHYLWLNCKFADTFYCRICKDDHKGLNYQCERCDYYYGIRCIVKEATTNTSSSISDGSTQGHILTFHRDQPSDCQEDDCLLCIERLRSQPILRCEECEFILHIRCVLPLTMSVMPPTFQSKFHEHHLTLTNCFAEGYNDDSSWPYCDVCDENINPILSFYYCAQCDFADDLTCALREMGRSFAHILGNMTLNLLPVVIENPSSTVSEILESITEDDKKIFKMIVKDDQGRKLNDAVEVAISKKDQAGRKILLKDQQDDGGSSSTEKKPFAHEITEEEYDQERKLNDAVEVAVEVARSEKDQAGRKILLKDQQDDGGSSSSTEKKPFAHEIEINDDVKAATRGRKILVKDQKDDSGSSTRKEPLVQIMEIFESKRQDSKFGLTYYDTRSQVTFVDGHMISKNLEPVLKALFYIYGDFSAKSKMSQHGNTFIFVILCAAIYSICNTKDAEINECQLLTCWDCFKIATHAGFEVQFAINRLRRAMLSYFGLCSTIDNDDAAMKELEKKCKLLDNKMENLGEDMKARQEKRELRMTNLLSYSMGSISKDIIIEIVGPKKVLTSWDDEYWDDPSETSKQECRSETSEPERLTLGEEGQKNGTLKLVRYSKARPESDWQEYLMNLIKTFIERKDDEVFLVQKDCSKVFEQSVLKDPAHDCSSPKSSEALLQKINCGFHNKHTLTLFKKVKDKFISNKSNKKVKEEGHEAVCIACEFPISDDERVKSYHCVKCEIFLHNFCVNLPKEIAKHPLHPAHPLALDMDTERLRKTTTCNACGEKFRGSCGYVCQGCNFYLEVQCLFLEPEPTIQSHSHGNLLLLEEKRPTHSPHRCFACGKKIADPPFLRCPPCNISLHFQCPLSSTIASTFHEHALDLTPWYIGDADKPDCKICKKEISAMHPTYYCQECGYVAHINCATSNATFNV
ncbi:uncharacterized protein LOC130794165 [Actinidia eriantha]|uniref:uncharacterized protein LOC130794165 n=1 Tax=Actinidia eriantha TaxID=165200 RepID=UPI002582B825|nr:uncharacterized protein LOC130794165 [Actinidia eriantha]